MVHGPENVPLSTTIDFRMMTTHGLSQLPFIIPFSSDCKG